MYNTTIFTICRILRSIWLEKNFENNWASPTFNLLILKSISKWVISKFSAQKQHFSAQFGSFFKNKWLKTFTEFNEKFQVQILFNKFFVAGCKSEKNTKFLQIVQKMAIFCLCCIGHNFCNKNGCTNDKKPKIVTIYQNWSFLIVLETMVSKFGHCKLQSCNPLKHYCTQASAIFNVTKRTTKKFSSQHFEKIEKTLEKTLYWTVGSKKKVCAVSRSW